MLLHRLKVNSNWICVFVSVCFFVPYTWPQFWADRDQIWPVASLYSPDGHRGFSWGLWAPLEPVGSRSAHCLYAAANEWQASAGNSELVASNRNGLSTASTRIKHHMLWLEVWSSAIGARCNWVLQARGWSTRFLIILTASFLPWIEMNDNNPFKGHLSLFVIVSIIAQASKYKNELKMVDIHCLYVCSRGWWL